MSERKLIVFRIIILIIAIFLLGRILFENDQSSTSENGKENINPDNYKLTIEDIKKNYTEEKILNIEHINDECILVESQRETLANKFELYNLRTGDKDIMPTMPEYVALERIESENHILFLSSGKNSVSPFSTFPYYIRCIRVKHNNESADDFIALREEKYFELDVPVSSGSKSSSVLSNIIVTLDGIQVLFEPLPGQEDRFFAATADIPVTNTLYDEDNKQMTIEMQIEHVSDIFKEKKEVLTGKNGFIGSVKIEQGEGNVKLIVGVMDGVREYTARIKTIPDGLPFFEINFKS